MRFLINKTSSWFSQKETGMGKKQPKMEVHFLCFPFTLRHCIRFLSIFPFSFIWCFIYYYTSSYIFFVCRPMSFSRFNERKFLVLSHKACDCIPESEQKPGRGKGAWGPQGSVMLVHMVHVSVCVCVFEGNSRGRQERFQYSVLALCHAWLLGLFVWNNGHTGNTWTH